ncbi:hypothetical protein PG985_008241 [Apiospora marii]|uniref:Thioesterase domain-containing protein n=1 Tax=Apiospora marii TaxID=335849 RepID=A0ABR1RF34_9PEZI
MEKNPEVIQKGGASEALPLFLIHDGGGTTFAYHCLDPLDRPTYGIFNPYFGNGGRFEGGIRGMGRLYASIIRRTCAEPDFPSSSRHAAADGGVDILLGGWSLGGLLSLEVAKVLAESGGGVRVVGILMVDSIYPVNPPSVRMESMDHMGLGKSKNEFLTLNAMKEALRVIQEWAPPVWESGGHGGGDATDARHRRPRVSLLRARDPIPTGSDRVHVADIYRNDPTLGWDQYDRNMFTDNMSVAGNHFEMFSFKHIPDLSVAMKKYLDRLEMLGPVSP